ncbi:MAG: hypothetical protein U0S12_12625 [Fimbriimonadales bacterium]
MFLLSLIAGLASAQAGAVEITVYNQGFALVKENRTLQLRQGRQSVAIENVAAAIEPQSVGVRSLTDPTSFEVLEQNYQYDLISPTAILAKAVGQKIRFLRVLPNGSRETLEGKLVSSPTAIVNTGGGGQQTYNGMVIQTDEGRVILNPTGEIEVASIPEGLISKPTLLWDLDVTKPGPNEVELSYITQQMSWNASYVLTLDGAGSGDIRGWVSMNNSSGATYKDAKLKLLAGDVQRAQTRAQEFGRRGGAGGAVADKGFAEEAFFEYHLYTLQRPATLRNNEMKQLSLLEASGLKVEKKLILDSMQDFGRYIPGEGEIGTGNIKPMVRVEFVNSKANQMGMPLPQGTVKVFQRDKSGSVQLLGEDQIQHTPRDERVSLFVGRSFDIVGTRKRTNWRWADNSRRNIEETFEIEVRNRKETADTVIVLERHFGDWTVTSSNMTGTKPDSETLQFIVPLKAGEVKKILYTVVTKW